MAAATSKSRTAGNRKPVPPKAGKPSARAEKAAPAALKKAGAAYGREARAPAGRRIPQVTDFREVYATTPDVRIGLIKNGVSAIQLKDIAHRMAWPNEKVFDMLNLPAATVNRKASRDQRLSTDASERVVGMSKLIGQVETMIVQSGNAENFDAAKWAANWLDQPVPALGGKRPAEYMDTIEGQNMVSDLFAMMQSGAYA